MPKGGPNQPSPPTPANEVAWARGPEYQGYPGPDDAYTNVTVDGNNQLDLSAIHAVYGEEKRGQPPYDPRLRTKLLVYGYCTGAFSSRRIQKRLQEDIPFKVLAAGNEPDFRTISDFRKIHIATLQGLSSRSWRWRWKWER
jgi:transposase